MKGRTSTVLGPAMLVGRAMATDFRVITMNVAGLPDILNSNDVPGDKTSNAETIGSLFAEYDYDVIHVQEDFNYHAYVYSTDDHPYRTATSGGVPFGDGLNTLANFDWTGFVRKEWDDCSDDSGWDCWTPKGFTYMRMLVSSSSDDGTTAQYVDFYNVHTDAGTEDGDEDARNSNLAQVSEYIQTWSLGVPAIVAGDTNSRYSRTADNIDIFTTENDMLDAWAELIMGGTAPTTTSICDNPSLVNTCEIVDKVFYRGSGLADLEAVEFNYVSSDFLQDDGNILSDHNVIRVSFALTDSSALKMSPLLGGAYGDPFSDVDTVAALSPPKVSEIVFSGGSRLDSVGVVLSDGTELTHGGTGGTESSLTLGPDEYWTDATLCVGEKDDRERNFYISATTSSGNTVEAGTQTDDCADFSAPSGWQVVGFIGRDGDEMDQIGLLFGPQ
ncbi:hypothetical protein MKZ38_007067 [Zalerion maritima]|uniref:Jacalin-type lectin domain-containing protein n=1 Tax=Zalerion maritima TaxID=339359 RepID=A0AAD5RN24_9PEZI|nr:hypothetical protein MKZ38_007067 [Zalerion maritima]